MKPNCNVELKPVSAEVISLEAYRQARSVPAPARPELDSLMAAYCRWLALGGAPWAFWW